MSRVYETSVKIGAFISKAFKGDTLNAAGALKKLTDQTKQLKAAEKAAGAYKKLSGELTRAKGRYDTASSALRKLEEAERAAGGATKESTKWRKAGEREVAAAARQLDRATKAAQKNAEALTKLGVDTAKMATEQDRLTRALAATERQEKSLERYEHARERLFGKRKEKTPLFEKAGEQFRSIGETVLRLAEGAAVAGEAMHLLVDRTMHAGADIGETAERIGIGARALQELRYGAQQSGAQVEDLDRALEKMAMNVGHYKILKPKGAAGGLLSIPGVQSLSPAAGGAASSTIDPFKQIGLSAKALSQLKPEDQLKKIADGLLKLKTHAERAYIAQEIFGKGAASILPYLAEGSEGIEKLSRNANKYGGVLSDEAVKASLEAEKASKDMDLALAGLANTLGSALLPTAVKTFRGISSWVGKNQVAIKKWAENAAHWIEDKGIPTFKHIAVEAQDFASKVLFVVNAAAKLTGGLGNLAFVVAGLRVAPLALTLTKIGVQGFKAADAMWKFAAASKAAGAAGMVEGGKLPLMGKALGLAATAQMVIGAAAVGYAIGTALDNYFHLSDKLSQLGVANGEDKSGQQKIGFFERFGLSGVRKAQANAQTARNQEQIAQVKKLQSVGYTYEQASAIVYRGATVAQVGGPARVPRTGGGGGGASIGPIHIHPGATRSDVSTGMDKAKSKALEEFDRREAHRKRVAYGG